MLLDVYNEFHITMTLLLKGDIVSTLDRRLARFVFSLINHDNAVVKYITKLKLSCPLSTLP